jgi:hypothetical protein
MKLDDTLAPGCAGKLSFIECRREGSHFPSNIRQMNINRV